jgi:hypothetical protein
MTGVGTMGKLFLREVWFGQFEAIDRDLDQTLHLSAVQERPVSGDVAC